jgi:hypothetical protein
VKVKKRVWITEEWEKTVPESIGNDSLWKMKAYRLALFATEVGWVDARKIVSKTHFSAFPANCCNPVDQLVQIWKKDIQDVLERIALL